MLFKPPPKIKVICTECKGKGTVEAFVCSGCYDYEEGIEVYSDEFDDYQRCIKICDSGEMETQPCWYCKGKKTHPADFLVLISAFIKNRKKT